MTTKEKLSALIDGELNELDERRTLKAMAEERELRDTWERYHLIRAVMTRQLDMLASPGLPERVLARLDEAGERVGRAPLRFWPLLGGFAAAASIAAVAILTIQTFQSPTIPSGPTVAVAGSNTSVVASTPASRAPVAAVATNSVVAPTEASDVEDRLNLYLVGHNEFMPIAGMGGMLPYVRVVTHNQEQQ